MSILIVDDNAVSARMVEVSLQRNGYQTTVVSSASAALEVLNDALDVQLIILDIMMPGMDGLSLLGLIRERSELVDLPVILCTSRTDPDTLARARELGCVRVVGKPIRLAELLARVREETTNERPVLQDRYRVMSKIGVDFQTYRDVVQAFAEIVEERIRGLEAAVEDGSAADFSGLCEAAELIGAERLCAVIRKVESMGGQSALAVQDRELQQLMLLRELKLLRAPLQNVVAQG
jgi:CheY-like chemotaxis protein